MKSKTIYLAIIICGLVAVYFMLSRVQYSSNDQDSPENLAIRQLWSSDATERKVAKEKLLQLGTKSIKPLTDLMTDLVRNPSTKYGNGKNQKDFDEAFEQSRLGKTPEEKANAIQSIRDIVINQRLMEDVCELLGSLHAQEAIPILIEAMEQEESVSGNWERMNPPMEALVKIGSASVPKAIEALETAEPRESAVRYADGTTPSTFRRKTNIATDQARAALVLGEIGDVRALPSLESFLRTTDNQWLMSYFEEAIKKIKKKNKLK